MKTAATVTELYKACRTCGESKPATADAFYVKGKGGRLDSTCKSCRIEDGRRERRGEPPLRRPKRRKPLSVPTSETRACKGCGESFPLSSDYFFRHPTNRGGFEWNCKNCRYGMSKAYGRLYRDPRSTEERRVAPDKVCRACGRRRNKKHFRRASEGKGDISGLVPVCFECQSKRNAERHAAYMSRWIYRVLTTVRSSYTGSLVRRKRTANWAPSEVDEELLWELLAKQQGLCHWTNLPLLLEEPRKPRSVSVDRIDCARGYTKDNVVLACRAANLGRSDSSPEDFAEFIRMIKET